MSEAAVPVGRVSLSVRRRVCISFTSVRRWQMVSGLSVKEMLSM